MTVEDLELKRDNLKNVSGIGIEYREMVKAIYNVGIAIVEVLEKQNATAWNTDGSMFETIFGKNK